ncbi:hypothetical protein M3Y96_01062300 [Aphelenchoides besseyi]|nr:hypothetical protein M3Y96_01062300 [Aphelenchoides besseyi]
MKKDAKTTNEHMKSSRAPMKFDENLYIFNRHGHHQILIDQHLYWTRSVGGWLCWRNYNKVKCPAELQQRGDEVVFPYDHSNECDLLTVVNPPRPLIIFKKHSLWINPVNAVIRNNSVAIVRIFRKCIAFAKGLVSKNRDDRKSHGTTNHNTKPIVIINHSVSFGYITVLWIDINVGSFDCNSYRVLLHRRFSFVSCSSVQIHPLKLPVNPSSVYTKEDLEVHCNKMDDSVNTTITKLRVLFPREFPIIKVIADQLNATIEPHTLYDSGNKDEKIYIGRIAYPLQKTIIRHGQFDFSTELYEVEFNILAIWTAVQLHLGQALNVTWKSYAVKFNILLVSVFQVIILMGVYSSYSLSQKLTIDGVANIDGPKELIEALESGERYFVSTTASDWFYEALNRSDAYPYKSLRRAVKRNPIYIAQTETEALERASSNGGLLVVSQDHPLNIQAKNYCNLVPMDDPIALVSTHLIFKKDSPLVDAVNQAIQVNRIAILKLVRKYMEYQKRIDNPACHKLRAPGNFSKRENV